MRASFALFVIICPLIRLSFYGKIANMIKQAHEPDFLGGCPDVNDDLQFHTHKFFPLSIFLRVTQSIGHDVVTTTIVISSGLPE